MRFYFSITLDPALLLETALLIFRSQNYCLVSLKFELKTPLKFSFIVKKLYKLKHFADIVSLTDQKQHYKTYFTLHEQERNVFIGEKSAPVLATCESI